MSAGSSVGDPQREGTASSARRIASDGAFSGVSRVGSGATLGSGAGPVPYLQFDFAAADLVSVEALVSVNNVRLFEVLRQVVDTCNSQFAKADELKARVAELERRTDDHAVQLSKVSPEAEAERDRRISSLEQRAAVQEEGLAAERGDRSQECGELRGLLDAAATRIGDSERRITEAEAAGARTAQVADRVHDLDKRLVDADASLRQLGERQGRTAKELSDLYGLFGTEPAEARRALDEQAAGGGAHLRSQVPSGPCVGHLSSLPIFRKLKMDAANELAATRQELSDDILETRSRVTEKLDKRLFEDYSARNDDAVRLLNSDVEQSRRRMDKLQESKADEEQVAQRVLQLQKTKADRGEIMELATVSDVARLGTRIDEVRNELTSLWERLEKMPAPRHSIRHSVSGDTRASISTSMGHSVEAIKLRLAEVERSVQVHTEGLAHLDDIKMDKKDLRELYGFLEKVTQRVDSMTGGGTPQQSWVPSASGPPSLGPGKPLQPQRPVTAPAARTSIRPEPPTTIATAGTVNVQAERPPEALGLTATAAATAPTHGTSASPSIVLPDVHAHRHHSPVRDRSPQRGNTRWGGGCQFVRGSNGVMWTAATRTRPAEPPMVALAPPDAPP